MKYSRKSGNITAYICHSANRLCACASARARESEREREREREREKREIVD